MDLVMPGVGGLSATRTPATDPRTSRIPVVIVSALADTMTLSRPFAVIAKPLEPCASRAIAGLCPFTSATVNRPSRRGAAGAIGADHVCLAARALEDAANGDTSADLGELAAALEQTVAAAHAELQRKREATPS